MTHSLSLKMIRSLIPATMRVKKIDGEYRVSFVGDLIDSAYFTNDAQDAINTANAMFANTL